jgi:hypothetical protein
VDERGHQPGCTEVFTSVVAKYGASLALPPGERLFQAAPVLWGARQRELKMKKWRCTCTNVRCATQLEATCDRCGRVFRLA